MKSIAPMVNALILASMIFGTWLAPITVQTAHAASADAGRALMSRAPGEAMPGLDTPPPGSGDQDGQSTASTDEVKVALLAEWRTLPAEGGVMWMALRQTMIPGWHTYYKNPGDSGEPTVLEWSLPEGFEAGEMGWPLPERLPYGPLVNFGFEDEAVLLVPVTVPAGLTPGARLPLEAHAYWLVCEEICIPQDAVLRLELPVEAGTPVADPEAAPLIAAAREALPQTVPWPSRFSVSDGTFALGVSAPELEGTFGPGRVEAMVFFPDESGVIDNPAPQIVRYGPDGFSLSTGAGFLFRGDGSKAPSTVSGLLVLTDRSTGETLHRGIRITAQAGSLSEGLAATALGTSAPGGPAALQIGLGQALLFALLGGLILNLMPCVFPILFMKAFGLVAAAQEGPMVARLHGLAFTAGVVVSFVALAGLFIALRAGGAQIGWGFQLQDPLVMGSLFLLMLAIGLNLSGVFEIGTSIMGAGGDLGDRGGAVGAFLTGTLATVVATPCTAPFMGAAIAAALTQPVLFSLTVFAALGLGMALPWLVLSFVPGLLRHLPKPGAWMEIVRQVLAFPMFGTAAWLLWVLTQQVGAPGLALVLAAGVVLGFGAWLFGLTQRGSLSTGGAGQVTVRLAAAVALLGAGTLLVFASRDGVDGASTAQASQSVAMADGGLEAVAFDPDRLEALRAGGTPVFLNVTAAWCITCLVNERVAFSQPAVARRFEEAGIVYMKGDWTNRDAQITEMLDRFGRSGVPLYVFYPPRGADGTAPDPIILPQLLRESVILETVKSL
ncbi:MAG: protein-disulfide reductase DsbD family protein [Alphaproteobacteria bacterium]